MVWYIVIKGFMSQMFFYFTGVMFVRMLYGLLVDKVFKF